MDDLISRQAAIEALNEYFSRIGKLKRRGLTKGEKAISLDTVGTIKTLPPAEPEIIHCEKCQFSEYDALCDDRYCHYDGKAEVVPDEHFCGYGRERQNG